MARADIPRRSGSASPPQGPRSTPPGQRSFLGRWLRRLFVWGFALARRTEFAAPTHAPAGLRFLDERALSAMFLLAEDLGPVPVEINRWENQVLVRYHETEWSRSE